MISKILIPALFALGGCVSNQAAPRQADRVAGRQIYVVVATDEQATCYIRTLENYPLDRVCVDGDQLRYSSKIEELRAAPQVPSAVIALFRNISAERVLRDRQALQQPASAQLTRNGTVFRR